MDYFEQKLKEIEEDILEKGDDFHLLAQHRTSLSSIYSRITEQLKGVLKIKAKSWKELRAKHKSNADAKSEWEASDEGIREMELKLDGKRIEKMMSSLKTLIDANKIDYWNTI